MVIPRLSRNPWVRSYSFCKWLNHWPYRAPAGSLLGWCRDVQEPSTVLLPGQAAGMDFGRPGRRDCRAQQSQMSSDPLRGLANEPLSKDYNGQSPQFVRHLSSPEKVAYLLQSSTAQSFRAHTRSQIQRWIKMSSTLEQGEKLIKLESTCQSWDSVEEGSSNAPEEPIATDQAAWVQGRASWYHHLPISPGFCSCTQLPTLATSGPWGLFFPLPEMVTCLVHSCAICKIKRQPSPKPFLIFFPQVNHSFLCAPIVLWTNPFCLSPSIP